MQPCECPQVIEVDGVEVVSEIYEPSQLNLNDAEFETAITVIEVIERGVQGPRGDAASISADTPNAIHLGKDKKMLVDDVTQTNCPTDFSNIYQLSK